MSAFHRSVFALVLSLSAIIFGPQKAIGSVRLSSETETTYRQLQAQAQREGYPDLAEGVGAFLSYRKGLNHCIKEQKPSSARSFAAFLDAIVMAVTGHLNHPSLRRKSYRDTVASYVTNAAALIEMFAREKARRFNGSAGRIDDGDEALVTATRRLHSRMGGLLRVSVPSLDSAIAQWSRADWQAYTEDPNYGPAAAALIRLDPSTESYCRVVPE